MKPGIRVLRFEFARVLESSCAILRKAPARLGLDADLLFVRAALGLEGRETVRVYGTSYLSIMFPSVDLQRELGETETHHLATMKAQMSSKLRERYKDDLEEILELSRDLFGVYVNGRWYLSHRDERLVALAAKHAVLLTLGGD